MAHVPPKDEIIRKKDAMISMRDIPGLKDVFAKFRVKDSDKMLFTKPVWAFAKIWHANCYLLRKA